MAHSDPELWLERQQLNAALAAMSFISLEETKIYHLELQHVRRPDVIPHHFVLQDEKCALNGSAPDGLSLSSPWRSEGESVQGSMESCQE